MTSLIKTRRRFTAKRRAEATGICMQGSISCDAVMPGWTFLPAAGKLAPTG